MKHKFIIHWLYAGMYRLYPQPDYTTTNNQQPTTNNERRTTCLQKMNTVQFCCLDLTLPLPEALWLSIDRRTNLEGIRARPPSCSHFIRFPEAMMLKPDAMIPEAEASSSTSDNLASRSTAWMPEGSSTRLGSASPASSKEKTKKTQKPCGLTSDSKRSVRGSGQ